MKKIALLVLLAALSLASPAAGASCDGLVVSGMTEDQIIKLKQNCIDLSRANNPAAVANHLAEYAELGQKYGVALSEVAKSLGTTVNELARTPVGIFLLIMVGWRIIGHDLLGVLGGAVWFTVMLPIWVYIFNRMVLKNTRVDEKVLDGKVVGRITLPINFDGTAGATAFLMCCLLMMICASGFFMIF